MDNKVITKSLKLYGQLLELHEENPFKVKAVNNASFKLSKFSEILAEKSIDELSKIDGVGKSVAAKIIELIETGKIEELENLKEITPTGVIEMLAIKGLGPKKIRIIWIDLQIESIGELYYACNENRLVEAKGFGLKTQDEVKKLIEFLWGNSGKVIYANAEQTAIEMINLFHKQFPELKIEFTGELRRKCEIIECIELLIETENTSPILSYINSLEFLNKESVSDNLWIGKTENNSPLKFHFANSNQYNSQQFKLTGTQEHFDLIKNLNIDQIVSQNFNSEKEIYQSLGLNYIEPELREGITEIEKSKNNQLPKLIELADLKGSLHNHSTWSDGIHSLKEMANYCRDLGYEYLGICDHSQSAFYANGLKVERVLAQHQEIDLLNQTWSDFKIFKGIESDILNDGRLDYEDEVLKQFDFVVASIHSNLKMDLEKATQRLIKAIEKPYTTILGHPTGRLLLARKGYPIDHQKVIDACAENKVVIEINANPLRLDLDWRWIDYALSKNVMLAINPDAHRKEGFKDMYFGIAVSRKGGLTKEMCLNSLTSIEISNYFQNRKLNIK